MSENVVSVAGVQVVLGGRRVLTDVGLDMQAGEIVSLLGANGSGKSTLVRAVVGLLPLTAGAVELFGTPLPRFSDWRRVGYVPQRMTAASGVPATVTEVVEAGRLSRAPLVGRGRRRDRAAVEHALAMVSLTERARDSVHTLSGGQQQRVLVARALAGEPDLLILDEPMAGVDLPSQQSFAQTLRSLQQAGTSVLLVAHELGPAEPLIDRAVVLRDGHVTYVGPPPPAVGHHAGAEHDHVHPHTGSATLGETGWLR